MNALIRYDTLMTAEKVCDSPLASSWRGSHYTRNTARYYCIRTAYFFRNLNFRRYHTQPVIRARSEYHTQLAKMSFDKIFDLTAGVYFNFFNITCKRSLRKK